jgi:aconitate hydratase 2/2-methylisocitrate dehydratase
VAFVGALGVMPLDMSLSVLVRLKKELQSGITLRDIVNAIPYVWEIRQELMIIQQCFLPQLVTFE